MTRKTKQDLKTLLKRKESGTLEFKQTLSAADRLVEIVCSFANAKGGLIVVGVSDSGAVKGLDVGRQTVERLTDKVVDNTDPNIYPDISVEKIDDKKVILVEVKESSAKPHTAFGRPFIRVGKNTKLMKQSEYEKMLLHKNTHRLQFDSEICEGAGLKDIDSEKVKWFLKKAKLERRLRLESNTPTKEAMERLGLLSKGKLTNSAILMFGKDPQKFFLQAETRCAKFKGVEPVKPFIDMKVLGGTVYDQIDGAERFVMNNIQKSAWLIPGQVAREEKWEYPLDAIREAITNALCHRDYSSTSNVQVRIFEDRIEVWNPGSLPEGWTVETLKQKHESKPKNPLIARLFFLIKYIEQWGTGTNEMIKKTLEHGLPEPVFEDTKTSIVITFRKAKVNLNERQEKAIKYIIDKGKITRREYESLSGISYRMANIDLKDLEEKGIIKKKGRGRSVYYVLQ